MTDTFGNRSAGPTVDTFGNALPTVRPRPYWLPDTQGFLAIAIITLMGTVVLLLLQSEPKFDDKTAGVLMTVLGVLTACLKDVYSFFFGSSKGEEKKGDVISNIATTPTPPPPIVPVVAPIVPTTTSAVGEAMLSNGERAYFRTLPDDEAKKVFLNMRTEDRAATIAKG